MPIFAAIDVGSNSCRLKIARVAQYRLKLLHEDREVTRLGASVFGKGLISPESMASTLRALKRFQRAVQSFGADHIRAVGTSALRDARNGEAFRAWVKAETGWDVEVISGLEEARLIHRGIVSNEPGTAGRILLIDLGGGSCEISLSERKSLKETISLPLGAVRLTEEFLQGDPATPEEIARMRKYIERELRRAERKHPHRQGQDGDRDLRHGGGVGRRRPRHGQKWQAHERPASRPGNLITPAADVRRLATKLTRMSNQQRALVPGIGPRRSEIIIAGAHVFAELMERLCLPGFRYSPMGLRDGILAQMLAEPDSRTLAHQQFERERWESVFATCRCYGVDPKEAEPVRQHAAQLFRDLEHVHRHARRVSSLARGRRHAARCGKIPELSGPPPPRAIHCREL